MNLKVKDITKMKDRLRKAVKDKPALFESCWRNVLKFARQGDISNYYHLKVLYNSIASYKVNNPRSKFYMYGG